MWYFAEVQEDYRWFIRTFGAGAYRNTCTIGHDTR